jgi:hypothetical protein
MIVKYAPKIKRRLFSRKYRGAISFDVSIPSFTGEPRIWTSVIAQIKNIIAQLQNSGQVDEDPRNPWRVYSHAQALAMQTMVTSNHANNEAIDWESGLLLPLAIDAFYRIWGHVPKCQCATCRSGGSVMYNGTVPMTSAEVDALAKAFANASSTSDIMALNIVQWSIEHISAMKELNGWKLPFDTVYKDENGLFSFRGFMAWMAGEIVSGWVWHKVGMKEEVKGDGTILTWFFGELTPRISRYMLPKKFKNRKFVTLNR